MMAAGRTRYARGEELEAAKIIPGRIPDFVPGKLPMKWADEAMIKNAAQLHPFDLQGRMNIAVNARTACVDPNLGYITYSYISFHTKPAYMLHTVGDFVNCMGRHTDSLWLNRSATNDRTNNEIVHRLAQNAMNVVDQGVAWNPPKNPFLWSGEREDRLRGRWAHMPEVTRIILGLMSYYRATSDTRALKTAGSIVHGFYEIAQKNTKYLWFPDYNYEQVGDQILPIRVVEGFWTKYPSQKRIQSQINVNDPLSGTGDIGGNFPAAFMGLLLIPVMRYYDETKDSVAAELATKFSRLVVDLMPDFAANMVHSHSNLATISGIFRVGEVFSIPEFKDWSEATYKKFVAQDYITDFGWTPENSARPRVKGRLLCETCNTVDFLEAALQLARDRNEMYWDDAERIAMNELLEGQLLRIDFPERLPASVMKPFPNIDPKWYSADHVMERSLGGFGLAHGPNDWIQTGEDVMTVQCTFGSGPRGLYDAWYYAAQEDQDRVRVNMQFSKRLPSAVITSYMPGKAVLEVEMTAGKKLQVRKPGWAAAEQTRVLVSGQQRTVRLEGTYFDFGALPAGTKVRIEFSNELRRKTERIGEVEFHTEWRGNAIVKMDPAGEIYPLYQGRDLQNAVTPLLFINPSPINPL
jgi:hypothetical protein